MDSSETMEAEAQANGPKGFMEQADEAAVRSKQMHDDAVREALEQGDAVQRTLANQESPEQAFARKCAQAPRTMVDTTRIEVCTGMVWLADGTRISFKLGLPPAIQRLEGVRDGNGMPVYDMPWQLQCIVKPPKEK